MLQMGGLLALVAILTSTQLLSTVRLVLSACSYAEASPCAGADPYAVADPFPEAGPAAPPGLPGCKPAPDWNSHTCMTWRLTSAHLVAADVGALVHAHMPPQTLLLHQSSQPASQGQASRPTALVASAVAAHKQVDTFNVRLAPEQVWRLQQRKAACQTAKGGDTSPPFQCLPGMPAGWAAADDTRRQAGSSAECQQPRRPTVAQEVSWRTLV